MTASERLHVIFGTGPLGNAVMEALVEKGKPVRMVNRSGKESFAQGVQVAAGDGSDSASARELCKDASVVYHCANPPYNRWPELFPPLQAGIIEGAASAGAKLVSAENTYMYGEVSEPQTEDLPYAATTRKGRVRAEMAKALMDAHESGKIRAAIGRGSDFYGPHVLQSAVGERVFYPALEGKKANVLGILDVPHTYTYIKDFGKALVKLGEHDEALGEVWHVPNAESLTTREFLSIVFEEAGHTPNMATLPKMLMRILMLFNWQLREMWEMMYEFEKPFIIDSSKYVGAFGDESTPLREAVRETVEWFRENRKA